MTNQNVKKENVRYENERGAKFLIRGRAYQTQIIRKKYF